MTEEQVNESMPSRQLDEYRLEALLGQGGMACVYRAFDVRLKRWAAVKVINPPFRTDADYVMRFEREAQAIAQLNHPQIVGVYRSGEADNLLYLAMEYLAGADLAYVLTSYQEDNEYILDSDASRIVRQICLALDYAHSKGVIHRDVKPSNIMLDEQGNAILTDFGLALLDDKTRGEIFGSPHYIAPEQAISSAGAVPQSDLYSLGVILYEMFTNQLPFDAPHPHDVAMLHLSEPPPPPRSVNSALSAQVEAVILKALAKEPGERYQSGLELADALDQALGKALMAERASPAAASASSQSVPDRVALKLSKPTPPDDANPPPLPPRPVEALSPSGTPLEEAHLMTPHYIIKNIRALLVELMEGFTEKELHRLFYDVPDFQPIHRQLADSAGKAEIADRLLEYAEQTLQFDKLLRLAREHSTAIYHKYQPYYEMTEASQSDLAGRTLGKYHVADRVGHGGMAEVYKAYQPGLARYVAIKMIHGHLVNDEELMERFETEALAVAGLRHPNIIQVFDFDREGDRCYMVMEFVAGPTLKDEIGKRQEQKKLFSLTETAMIFDALAKAIDYAHAQGMVHRDLKPSNIMFSANGRLVLTDFGIALVDSVPSYTVTNALMGTPTYMSPEQAEGKHVDKQSDIYSLGVILYELATGRLPFAAESLIAIINELISGSWVPPQEANPDLPATVARVIVKAMSKDPADRFQSAATMSQALHLAITTASSAEPERARHEKKLDEEYDELDLTLAVPSQEGIYSWNAELQKIDIPEVNISPPRQDELEAPEREASKAGFTLPSNSGQIALGGQQVIQFGNISGGQVSVGLGNVQLQPQIEPSNTDKTVLGQMLAALKDRVEVEAPSAKKGPGLERLAELEEAVINSPPDLDTIAYVKGWFSKNISELEPAVADLIVHPVVKKFIAAAGEAFSAEFKRRFGQ